MAPRSIDELTVRYREQLLAEVIDHAEIEGQEAFISEAFTDLVLDDLEQDGRWPDFQLSHLHIRGAAVDAWALDEDRRLLFLAITDFDRTSASMTIPASDIDRLLNRLTGFISKARRSGIDAPDHNPVADLLEVAANTDRYDAVHAYVLTHRVAPESAPDDRDIDGLPVVTRVWDLETIRRSRESGVRLDPIDIAWKERFGHGLPALMDGHHTDVQTYLLFVPGNQLAEIYQEHGGRLLERNVRAFLSARGKINRGIRDTLRLEPERFLAYNNGLTATAAAVRRGEDDASIEEIHDLQIVNGGQTTASLAVAARDPEVNLTNVSVQVKLVVVGEELLDEMVPNISKYANRQNAVQESDLSANHDYLRKMQEASRTEWTPAAASGRPTKWYFERARGSYSVDHTNSGPPAAQKRFLAEYPKNQRFGKNELALFENTWECLPHLVCRGGQKNFIEFMVRLEEPAEDLSGSALDSWYRDRYRSLVAKAIIFKSADQAVRRRFGGTYKRQVAAYTLSFLLHHAAYPPDLAAIWREQQISPEFVAAVIAVARPLKDELISSAGDRNITEWAKNEACWTTLRECRFEFAPFTAATSRPARRDSVDHREEKTGAVQSAGRKLADAIEEIHGEAIQGNYKRYRRKQWRHLGDTGVPAASAGATFHAYAAPMTPRDRAAYVFNVVVDFPAREITPIDQLDQMTRSAVETWLAQNGFPA